MRSSTSAALSNDPLGDLNPQLTYDINLHASVRLAKAAKEAGVARFLFSSSCSLYGAGGDEPLDENAAFNPVTPYGESKVRVEQEVGEARRRQVLARRTCATPPPTASRAGCAPTSSSTTSSATRSPPARSCCRATARRGARSSTSRDIIHAFEWCLTRAHATPSTTRRSTSGASARTSASARSPTWSRRSSRTARSRSRRAPRPTRATTGSTSPRSRPSCPGTQPTVDAAQRHRGAVPGVHEEQDVEAEWTVPRYYRLKTIKRLQESGAVDADLRRVST